MSAMRFVPAKVNRSSLSTGPPASEATMTSAPGMREKIVCGPVKSSCVRPG
jgi:hypothetical protein